MDNRRKPPQQTSLFDDPTPDVTTLVAVANRDAPLNATQRTFNQLTDKIRRRREALARWEAYTSSFHQRLTAELMPVERDVRDAQRRLIHRFDALMTCRDKAERLSQRHRRRVRFYILSLVDDILADGPDAEIEALYDKYSDASREQQRREEMDLAESFLSAVVGPEAMAGHQARDIDELLDHASEKMAEQTEAQERKREAGAARRRARKDGAAAERKAQAERDASRSVREIFRKLASELHPDRETDTTERERKTRLMQRVNQAYERDDLLELLALQIEIEQIDADHLANTPEERLRHYNEVLRQQLRALDVNIEECLTPFRLTFPQLPFVRDPHQIDQALDAQIADMRKLSNGIERDLKKLDHPQRRRRFLDELPDGNIGDSFSDFAMFAEALDGMFAQRPQRRKRRR